MEREKGESVVVQLMSVIIINNDLAHKASLDRPANKTECESGMQSI
jgi:hypothetical protein